MAKRRPAAGLLPPRVAPRVGAYDEPVSLERLERALVLAAYVVSTGGEIYAPLLERLEAEVEAARKAEAPRDRAQRILERYTVDGTLKAIR